MKKEKGNKKHGLRFGLSITMSVFLVLATLAYVIGIYAFGYYDDFNVLIPMLTVFAIILSVAVAILMEKKGNQEIFSLLTIAVSALIVVALMTLISARVYSFAILLLSDLEKDRVDGYRALYFSIGAAGLYMFGLICNFVAGFIGTKKVSG